MKTWTGNSVKLAPWHPVRAPKVTPKTDQETMAEQIAYARIWAERWAARGNSTKAAARAGEEQEILQNARNFKIRPCTEEQIQAAMIAKRADMARQEALDAEEQA